MPVIAATVVLVRVRWSQAEVRQLVQALASLDVGTSSSDCFNDSSIVFTERDLNVAGTGSC
jgi:hypothetical protein